MSRPAHRVEIASYDRGAADGTVKRVWRMACSCGHATEHEVRFVDSKQGRAAADRDRQAHLESVALPPDRRCKDVTRHRMRWWDTCPVCAGQMALPGLEDLAGAA